MSGLYRVSTLSLLFLLLLGSGVGLAQNPALEQAIVTEEVRALFRKELENALKVNAGNPELLIRNGVVADRKAREVRIRAVATGVTAHSPVEFLLVGEHGKDYESLTLTLAKAFDIHQAIEFIGLKAGHPVQPDKFRFWSRGERMDITISWTKDGQTITRSAGEALWNSREKTPWTGRSWIFAGSTTRIVEGKELYLGDDTGDIITTYNSSWTVLDVPDDAAQSAVYGMIECNPDNVLQIRTPVEIVLRPQLPVGESRLRDYRVTIAPPAEAVAGYTAESLRLTLTRLPSNEALLTNVDFKQLLTALAPDVQAKRDIFLHFEYDKELKLASLAGFFEILNEAISRGILKVEPTEGQLFYQGLLPNAEWREVKLRPTQPIEIHFGATAEEKMLFCFNDEEFTNDGNSVYKLSQYRFSTEEGLMKILSMRERWDSRTVLFYVQPDTTYGALMTWHRLLVERFPTVYVFQPAPKKE